MKQRANNRNNNVLVTVTGLLRQLFPAANRPGCILEMTDGHTVGHYYVPLQPHDCKQEFREGEVISFRIWQDAAKSPDGSYPTAGTTSRLWNAITC